MNPDAKPPVSEYRFRRRVQFYETDVAGIVHFSWFYRYMEEAEHALWREAGLSIHPHDSEIGWPRVSASFDFHRALRFEDEFDVEVKYVAAATSVNIHGGASLGDCIVKGTASITNSVVNCGQLVDVRGVSDNFTLTSREGVGLGAVSKFPHQR